MSAPPTPHLSVVLPFRNASATLREALESLSAQTFDAFECILVDHASTDASPGIAYATAARDARFRVMRSDGSFARALNCGTASARAPLIARMDADDLAHPQRFARQMATFAADPSLALVSCLVESFPAAAVRDGMRRYEAWLNGLRTPEQIRDALFVESPFAHPSVVVRRSVFDAVGGYREFDGPEDYDLWLRILLDGQRAAKVPEILLYWRESAQRLSRVDARYHRRRFLETKLAHVAAILPALTPLQICGAGSTGRSWARRLVDRGYTVSRFIDVVPGRWGRTVCGATVHPPHTPERRHGYVIAAAGAHGARERIEGWLRGCGLRPWHDYLAVA